MLTMDPEARQLICRIDAAEQRSTHSRSSSACIRAIGFVRSCGVPTRSGVGIA